MVSTPRSRLLGYEECCAVVPCSLSSPAQRWEDMSVMRFRSRFAMAMTVLLRLVLATIPVHAQDDPQPSKDPAVFKAQLLQFTQLTRKNLREIQALSPDDTTPIDPALKGSAHRAYQLIRAAQWGMGVAIQQQTYRDPMLVLAQKRAEQAWILARYAVDNTNAPRPEYISQSVQNLTQALRLVQ